MKELNKNKISISYSTICLISSAIAGKAVPKLIPALGRWHWKGMNEYLYWELYSKQIGNDVLFL
jgi:uncharacterized membrane protein (DUF2068 family)